MKKLKKDMLYVILTALGIVMIFPFFWMISCAFRRPNELLTSPPRLLPASPTVSSFIHVLFETEVPRYFMNSVIIATTATVLCICVAIPAAYSFARHNYRGKNLVMVCILLCNMIPRASTLVPLYRAMDRLQIIDTHFGIAFTHLLCMLPFSIIMLKGFIRTIPPTLEEAAMIDGCTKLQAIFKIIVPVCSSGIFATAMYAFMISWEEFLYAMTFSTSSRARTISIGLKMFSTEFKVDWSSILAAATLMTLPILILFFMIQDTFIKGATNGALKE